MNAMSNETETKIEETTTEKPKAKKRGFAAIDPKLVAKFASMGGKQAHANGTAHRFTKETAAAAGRLGGRVSQKRLKEAKAAK